MSTVSTVNTRWVQRRNLQVTRLTGMPIGSWHCPTVVLLTQDHSSAEWNSGQRDLLDDGLFFLFFFLFTDRAMQDCDTDGTIPIQIDDAGAKNDTVPYRFLPEAPITVNEH